MGDRANVCVVHEDGSKVFIYTHWSGQDLPAAVHAALCKQWRWTDSPYLTRIIYDEVVGDLAKTETGFGISTNVLDNDGYPIIVVDVEKQEVRFMRPSRSGGVSRDSISTWSFKDFVKAGVDTILDAWLDSLE